MNQKLTNQIYDEFPKLMLPREEKYSEKTHPMQHWGLQCLDGWYDIVVEALKKIRKLDHLGAVKISQIKEKLGGLRIYFVTDEKVETVPKYTEALWIVCNQAETQSYVTCEVCGKPGVLCETPNHWLKTVCEKHRTLKNSMGEERTFSPVGSNIREMLLP
jgi:hypothetical protein